VSEQVDLDEMIAESAGLALVPDWLLARARRSLNLPTADVGRLGLSLPTPCHVWVSATLGEVREAAGVSGRRQVPRLGAHTIPVDRD